METSDDKKVINHNLGVTPTLVYLDPGGFAKGGMEPNEIILQPREHVMRLEYNCDVIAQLEPGGNSHGFIVYLFNLSRRHSITFTNVENIQGKVYPIVIEKCAARGFVYNDWNRRWRLYL